MSDIRMREHALARPPAAESKTIAALIAVSQRKLEAGLQLEARADDLEKAHAGLLQLPHARVGAF
eukprot:6888036-Prorocentrum_lima.AAC.1